MGTVSKGYPSGATADGADLLVAMLLDHNPADRRDPRSLAGPRRGRSEALKGDHAPDRLDHTKGPSSSEKAIAAGQEAAECKGQNERPATSLERVHDHHEAKGQDAIDGNERHTPVCLLGGSRPEGSFRPRAHGPESAPRGWARSPSLGDGSKLIVKGF
jgi:hypothetical protein